MMKKIALVVLGLAVLGTSLAAQDRGPRRQDRSEGPGRERNFAGERLSLTGTLGLRRGRIVLESGGRFWYVPGLRPYTGFIQGLKAGAAVTLEGWELPNPRSGEAAGLLRVSKLTVDGTDYDLEGPALAREPEPRRDRRPAPYSYSPRHRRGPGRSPNWGPGRGCHPR
jgi:hypothetical protein